MPRATKLIRPSSARTDSPEPSGMVKPQSRGTAQRPPIEVMSPPKETSDDTPHEPPSRVPLFQEWHWQHIARRLDLSGREFELTVGAFGDLRDVEIAARLGMKRGTVRTHFERLYRKLNVHNRSSLLLLVFREYILLLGSALPENQRGDSAKVATTKLRHPP